jgi:uncharacterized membrane protein (DUF485 family)
MTAQVPQDDPALRRRNLRFAVVLGVVALAVYVAFFVIKGMGEG